MNELGRTQYALYQKHSEVVLSQGDAGPWYLMNVHLVKPNLEDGLHDPSGLVIYGLATQIPAVFESERLVFPGRLESKQVITRVHNLLRIPPQEIIQALGNNMVVVYSYSNAQSQTAESST